MKKAYYLKNYKNNPANRPFYYYKDKFKEAYIDKDEWALMYDDSGVLLFISCMRCRRVVTSNSIFSKMPAHCFGCSRDVPEKMYKAKFTLEKMKNYG